MSALGKRVMLVDLATRAASAEQFIGLAAGPGLSDLVAGKADFTKSVVRDQRSKLHFVRLGEVSGPAQEELIVSRLPAIAAALRTVYDIIVFNVGDARPAIVQVMVNVDANLLLASPSRLEEAASAAKAIEEAGTTKTMLFTMDDSHTAPVLTKASA